MCCIPPDAKQSNLTGDAAVLKNGGAGSKRLSAVHRRVEVDPARRGTPRSTKQTARARVAACCGCNGRISPPAFSTAQDHKGTRCSSSQSVPLQSACARSCSTSVGMICACVLIMGEPFFDNGKSFCAQRGHLPCKSLTDPQHTSNFFIS